MIVRRRRPTQPLPARAPETDVVAIAEAPARRRIKVRGRVVRMRSRPASGVPALAVTIEDHSGSAVVVWTGRQAIGGIGLGRQLMIEGVATLVDDRLEFRNPAYTLER